MGLFTRKVDNSAELATMQAELATMKQRLDEADAAKAQLAEELNQLAPPAVETTLPIPDGPTLGELAAQLTELTSLVAEQQQHIANVAIVATDAAEKATSTSRSDDLTPERDTDSETRAQVGQLAEKVAAMESRLHQVSLELANQLTELSTDLDSATLQSATPDSAAVLEEIERLMAERIDPTIVDITDGQERLAIEQARHAISFREELAELADKLAVPRR